MYNYIKIPWYIRYFTCIFNKNLKSNYFIAIFNRYLYVKKKQKINKLKSRYLWLHTL
ncbi:hypothetical protein Hanom_Chr14g01289931 [Helianthus anomalus]